MKNRKLNPTTLINSLFGLADYKAPKKARRYASIPKHIQDDLIRRAQVKRMRKKYKRICDHESSVFFNRCLRK